jgi:hypothetical protein
MKIVLEVQSAEEIGQQPWTAQCQVEGSKIRVHAAERQLVIAEAKRMVYQLLATWASPPRCVEFEVAA